MHTTCSANKVVLNRLRAATKKQFVTTHMHNELFWGGVKTPLVFQVTLYLKHYSNSLQKCGLAYKVL